MVALAQKFYGQRDGTLGRICTFFTTFFRVPCWWFWLKFVSLPTLSFLSLSLSRREIKTSSKLKNPFFIRINSGGIYIRRKGSICRGKEKSFSFLLSFFFAIRIKKFTLSRLHTFSQGWRRREEGITKTGASAEILIKSFKVARVKLLKDKRTKWRVSKA